MNDPAKRLKELADQVSPKSAPGGSQPPGNPDLFSFLLDEIPEIIRKRTQLGNGVPDPGAPNTKLKKLSPKYILARKGLKQGLVIFLAKKNLNRKDKDKIYKGTFSKKTKLFGEGMSIAQKEVTVKFPAKGLPELSEFTTPTKSNLTLTGQMLESIKGTRNGTRFTFSFSNSFAAQKARWVTDQGRRFFDLSKSERMGLERKIAKIIRENIRAIFK